MAKGGSTSSTVSVPQYIEDAAKRNLSRADDISKIGFVPNYGPDVAAATPMMEAAAQNVANTADYFGVGSNMSQRDIMGGMDDPTTYANGVQGYSSAPIFEQSLAALAENRPGQYDYINSMSIDPVTGLPGSRVGESIDYTRPPPVDGGGAGGNNNNDRDPFNIAPSYSNGSSDNSFASGQISAALPGGINDRNLTRPLNQAIARATDTQRESGAPTSDPGRPRLRDDSSGNDGGKLVCTAMNKMGLLPDDIYALDSEYGLMVNRDDPILGDGYRLWALPVSEYIKRDALGARALRAFMRPITLAWAKEMAHQMRPEEYKPNYAGKVIMAIGHPTCRIIGHVFIGGLTKRDV